MYRIVTGVTSDVGVPSTYLVLSISGTVTPLPMIPDLYGISTESTLGHIPILAQFCVFVNNFLSPSRMPCPYVAYLDWLGFIYRDSGGLGKILKSY